MYEDDIPQSEWCPLQNLIRTTTQYYNGVLQQPEIRSKVWNILQEFCKKVRSIKDGCLLAFLELEDEYHLSNLIRNLGSIAAKIRHMLITSTSKDVELSITGEKRVALPEEVQGIVPKLLEELTNRLRMQLSVENLKMLQFLKSSDKKSPLMVTLLLKMFPLDYLAEAQKDVETRKARFAKSFAPYNHMSKVLEEIFKPPEQAQKHPEMVCELWCNARSC